MPGTYADKQESYKILANAIRAIAVAHEVSYEEAHGVAMHRLYTKANKAQREKLVSHLQTCCKGKPSPVMKLAAKHPVKVVKAETSTVDNT